MSLSESFKAARQVTKHHAKSFYFSSFPLPPAKRDAAFAIYSFCRVADDTVDNLNRPPTHADLKPFTDLLDRGYALPYPDTLIPHAFAWEAAFIKTIHDYKIPRGLFEDLLEGMRLDVEFNAPSTVAELEKYCYHVAGCVGLIMTHIFGLTAPKWEEAKAMGDAMQITNILRDIKEDAERGRVYLPLETLARHGLNHDDVLQLFNSRMSFIEAQRLWPVVNDLIRHTENLYVKAEQGLPYLTHDGSQFCATLMQATYQGILEKLKTQGASALFERQRLSFFQKLLKVPPVYFRLYG